TPSASVSSPPRRRMGGGPCKSLQSCLPQCFALQTCFYLLSSAIRSRRKQQETRALSKGWRKNSAHREVGQWYIVDGARRASSFGQRLEPSGWSSVTEHPVALPGFSVVARDEI